MLIMQKKDFYLNQQDLLTHAKNPSNFGLQLDLDFVSSEYNPSCGDKVVIGAKIVDGVFKKVCFQGSGCVISLAMSSKLTEFLTGKSIIALDQLDEKLVYELLGIELGLNRLTCGLLPIMAFKKGLYLYQNKPSNTVK